MSNGVTQKGRQSREWKFACKHVGWSAGKSALLSLRCDAEAGNC